MQLQSTSSKPTPHEEKNAKFPRCSFHVSDQWLENGKAIVKYQLPTEDDSQDEQLQSKPV
jgi:hypothetical protein